MLAPSVPLRTEPGMMPDGADGHFSNEISPPGGDEGLQALVSARVDFLAQDVRLGCAMDTSDDGTSSPSSNGTGPRDFGKDLVPSEVSQAATEPSSAPLPSNHVFRHLPLDTCSSNSAGEMLGASARARQDFQLALREARNPTLDEQVQPTTSPRMLGVSSGCNQLLDSKAMKFKQEFDERRLMLKMQAETRADELTADAGLLNIPAESALKVQQKKAEAWKILQKAMGVDEAHLKKDSCDAGLMGVVNLSYLLVIVGCELDLYGFIMAWQSYWNMGRIEVQMLLIICPFGYLLATGMYMAYNHKVIQKLEDAKNLPLPAATKMHAGSSKEQSSSRLTAREPIKVEYYHFLPICRYYLVIKDKEAADIEGLFRVNSLSSFSLGICQICGILFQCFIIGGEVSVFVKINIASQFLNWFITLMYFMTPVSAMMKSSIKVDALVYNSNQEMRRLYENYMQLMADYARDGDAENREKLQHVEDSIDREICEFCKTKLDLSEFDMKTKFTALRLIRRKQYNAYAKI